MANFSDEIWLRTNETDQFVCALEFAAEIYPSVWNDYSRWKWFIIALHNALQGVFVCALSGDDTAGISYLGERSGKKMWEWLDVTSRNDETSPRPEEWLGELPLLYQRVQSDKYLTRPLISDPTLDHAVEKLIELRNEFIHFVPKAYAVDMSGMPQIIRLTCSAIEFLSLNSPSFGHRYREGDVARVTNALEILNLLE